MNQLAPLRDPRFNLREICKHLLLLEDHCCHDHKRCIDCIAKHLLIVEALADEAIALDSAGLYTPVARQLVAFARGWCAAAAAGGAAAIGGEVRAVRKQLAPHVLHPGAQLGALGQLAPPLPRHVIPCGRTGDCPSGKACILDLLGHYRQPVCKPVDCSGESDCPGDEVCHRGECKYEWQIPPPGRPPSPQTAPVAPLWKWVAAAGVAGAAVWYWQR